MTQGPNVSLGPTKSPSCRSLFRQSKIRRWRTAIAHFHDWHLSHDDTRICNSRHDIDRGREGSQLIRGWVVRLTRSRRLMNRRPVLDDPASTELPAPAAMRPRGRPTSRPLAQQLGQISVKRSSRMLSCSILFVRASRSGSAWSTSFSLSWFTCIGWRWVMRACA